MKYYFDTSVLFKLYHREEGSDAAELIYESAESIFVSEICHVEFYSTLAKKLRTKDIPKKTYQAVKNDFLLDIKYRLVVIPAITPVYHQACDLLDKHGPKYHLFSLDAVHLASYLKIPYPEVNWVSADHRLNKLAEKLGIPVQALSDSF